MRQGIPYLIIGALTGIIIMPMVVAGGVGFILNGTELLIAGHIMDLINGEE